MEASSGVLIHGPRDPRACDIYRYFKMGPKVWPPDRSAVLLQYGWITARTTRPPSHLAVRSSRVWQKDDSRQVPGEEAPGLSERLLLILSCLGIVAMNVHDAILFVEFQRDFIPLFCAIQFGKCSVFQL